jgi:hypothetical protein
VEAHFTFEGWEDCINSEDVPPELLRQAADLSAEHHALMDRIRQAIQHAAELNKGALSERAIHDFFRHARELLLSIRQHETRENALVVRTYNEDVGIGD